MGQTASDDIVVHAPPDAIFDVITDLEAYPDWAEGVLDVEILANDDEGRPLRARFHVDARVMEISYTLAYEYAADRISWKLTEGEQISQLDGTYQLVPNGDATHVRYALEVEIDLPLPRFLKRRAAKVILDTGLKGLKERVESGR